MALLRVENVSKFFGGVKAVHNCCLEILPNRITSLIGPNGAGKTTLFNLICGFLEIDTGKIFFSAHDISSLPAWKRSRLGISRTFQQSRLFYNLSIRENLALSIRQDDDRFWKMMRVKNMPQRFDTEISSAMEFVGLKKSLHISVRELSYGEQKLFDLTRALVNPHSILFLDEPVAGVNPVVREQLKKIIVGLKSKGESVLLIEHDMDFVRSVSDHVIVMDQGSVLMEGEPEKVLRDDRVLEAYLGKA